MSQAMRTFLDADGVQRLEEYFQRIGAVLGEDSRRGPFAIYAQYALCAMTQREPIEAWIIDDTGFLKQGKHSVGVQRQYTGSAGKITNCQIGVSLSLATRTEHLSIDFELHLPASWTNDTTRCQQARIPLDIGFKTKPQLAAQMIGRAVADGVPKGVVLADSAYGTSSQFRVQVRALGLHYAVGVDP